jgi:hypothetical protein
VGAALAPSGSIVRDDDAGDAPAGATAAAPAPAQPSTALVADETAVSSFMEQGRAESAGEPEVCSSDRAGGGCEEGGRNQPPTTPPT